MNRLKSSMSFGLPGIPGLKSGKEETEATHVEEIGSSLDVDSGSEGSLDTDDLERKKSHLSAKEEEAQDSKLKPEPDLMCDDKRFCTLSATLGLANLFVMGTEMDMRCHQGSCSDDESLWDNITHLFTAIFVLEQLVRIVDAKPRRFVCGDRQLRGFHIHVINCVDFMLVFLRVVDCWLLAPLGVQSGLRLFSIFRFIRIGPAVRHYQTSKGIRELWLVVGAISQTIQTLVWVGVFLFLVIWVCAVLVTMSLQSTKAEEFDFTRAAWSFKDYWGSVPASGYSLFQVVTRDSWVSSMIVPLIRRDPLIFIIFGTFGTIGILALLNTIVGVVVECTLSSAAQNTEQENEERKRAEEQVMASLHQIFIEADVDGSGSLDADELHDMLRRYKVRDRLKLLKIPFRDLDLLFTLLDVEGNGQVPTDMFFRGCAKIRGQAMACDLHQLSIDYNHSLDSCQEHSDRMRGINEVLAAVVDQVDEMDLSIMRDQASDAKDPIVKCRQKRPKVSKADVIRGRCLVPLAMNEQNMWMDLDRLESKGSGSGSRTVSKAEGRVVVRAAARGTQRDKADDKKKRVQAGVVKKDASAPAPPPMPSHLRHLEKYNQKVRQKAEHKVAKESRRRVHEFE
eukprot:gb/GFBE01013627.1/.p1 GENE.gb/GFBE01013627.1/~~gb/GFBE01013627.1/.p1  ORF type:complete len:622 (+),score=133.65 gb/GFBE01013627.1/:1-1866(+)